MNDLIDQIFKAFRYGIPKKKGTIYDLRENDFRQLKSPVFFLSTGRCGTKWFTELLSSDARCIIEHAPVPDLGVQGKIAYEMQQNPLLQDRETLVQYLQELFLAGREEQLRYAYKTDKRYIETNNHITFFAPAIAKLIPGSKFVHLYRHPGEFVRSAIRRNYYAENDGQILKRIVPQKNSEYSTQWKTFSQIQKASWLWNETNRFIESFKEKIPDNRIFNFNFNELNQDTISKLIRWAQLKAHDKIIRKQLHHKVNVQKNGQFARFDDWNLTQKQELIEVCGTLSAKYGYILE